MGLLKNLVLERGMQLLNDPRVSKLASDPRVMRAVMQAMAVPGQVQQLTSTGVEALARKLNLATEEEVEQLRRTVRRLEVELARQQSDKNSDEG